MEATLYNLRKMKVNQLKANLEKRGLKSTGLKTLLLKRLEKVWNRIYIIISSVANHVCDKKQ